MQPNIGHYEKRIAKDKLRFSEGQIVKSGSKAGDMIRGGGPEPDARLS